MITACLANWGHGDQSISITHSNELHNTPGIYSVLKNYSDNEVNGGENPRKQKCHYKHGLLLGNGATYTVVPGMQEVKQLLGAILFCGRSGANSALTLLQTPPSVHAVLCLLTLLSHRLKRVL